MTRNFRILAIAAAVAAAMLPAAALATDGYFSHGVGMKAKGMGGAGIALPQDALAAGTNPAGMAFLGNRVDFGVDWFMPDRSADISGIPNFGPGYPNFNGHYDGNEESNFFIPEFGYNQMLNKDLSLGVSVYGNGGMNTSYETPIPLFGTTKAGINLEQLFIAPTIAYKLSPDHAIGAALMIAYQRFEATGLQNFDNPMRSSSPGNVTDRGTDSSYGFGLRVGYTGHFGPMFTVGATYQMKTSMGELDKYKGLFAEQGGFDIPANYGIGFAFKPVPAANIAFDIVRIEYSGVESVGNPLLPNFMQAQLGANGGPGFGWKDVTAYKLGFDYAFSPAWTLRAGYNHTDQPVPASETLFNILAPGVVEDHYTLGATWTLANKGELTFAFMYAPETEIKGTGSVPTGMLFGQPGMPNGNADIRLSETAFGIAYGWKF